MVSPKAKKKEPAPPVRAITMYERRELYCPRFNRNEDVIISNPRKAMTYLAGATGKIAGMPREVTIAGDTGAETAICYPISNPAMGTYYFRPEELSPIGAKPAPFKAFVEAEKAVRA